MRCCQARLWSTPAWPVVMLPRSLVAALRMQLLSPHALNQMEALAKVGLTFAESALSAKA